MRRLALSVLLVLATAAPEAAAARQAPDLQPLLDSLRADQNATGAAAALIFPDGTIWQGASGTARPGVAVTDSTAFEVASIAKVYTAALVLQFVAEGEIRLDDDVAHWFPDLPAADRITVRNLLNHTNGLHDPLQEPDFVPAVLQNPAHAWTLADIRSRMKAPHFEPGAGWRYSNTGFHLLGAIVEALTDSAFADVLHARLFAPHALEATGYGDVVPANLALAAAYIDPSGSGTPQPVSLLIPWTAFRTSAGPAGAVVATAADAARFLHRLSTGAVLDDDGWREMTSWVDRPDGHRYGLGLLRIDDAGLTLIGHKGNSAGFSASAFHDIGSGITAVVLTNRHAVDVTPMLLSLLRAAIGHADSRPAGVSVVQAP